MTWSADVDLDLDIGFGSSPLAASPTWTDMSADVRGLTINRGRSSARQAFNSGTLTVTLDNRDGDYDPNNSSSPHAPNLKLGTPLRVQATHNMVTYDLFRGHISRWPLNYPSSGKDAVAVIEATENLALIRTSHLDVSYSQEKTDVRVGNILDDVSWAAGARALDAGVVEVAALSFEGDASSLLDATVEVEQGQFFIAKNGDATLNNRVAFSTAASQATFDPGTNLDYTDVQLLYDDDLLINLAVITASDNTSASTSDATSISDHGKHSFSSSNTSVIGEPDALNVAEWIVGKHKDVVVRVVGLTISPQEDPANLWPEALGRELQDIVTVGVDPPGAGDTLNQEVLVEGTTHDITPGAWRVSYTCHPLSTFETQEYWILGTSELGTGTRLA